MNLSEYDIECIEKARQIIDADISRHFTILELSRKVALGKTKLKYGFAFFVGQPIYQYLRIKRLEKAMELLTSTKKTVKQIAGLVGFQYENNFVAAFTSHFHTTPGKVRKKAN